MNKTWIHHFATVLNQSTSERTATGEPIPKLLKAQNSTETEMKIIFTGKTFAQMKRLSLKPICSGMQIALKC